MASVNKISFFSADAQTASENSDPASVGQKSKEFIAVLVATSIHTDTTFDAKLQHSGDGTNWFDLVSFTQITATSGSEAKNITDNVLPQVRAVTTLSGTTKQATVTIELYYS